MKKNDDIILEITALSGQGVGIGRYEGIAVFVDQTAVGDTVKAHIIKVKSNYCIGKLMEIISPSTSRKEVDCPAFSRCGGCSFRHIKYENELEIKQNGVYDAMKRIGGIDLTPNEITPSPSLTAYRNKAQYPIGMDENGIFYGFYAKHSHRVIKSENCMLQPPIFEKTMTLIKNWADQNNLTAYNEISGKGLLRHILLRYGEKTGELMVVVVINADSLPASSFLIIAGLRSATK